MQGQSKRDKLRDGRAANNLKVKKVEPLKQE